MNKMTETYELRDGELVRVRRFYVDNTEVSFDEATISDHVFYIDDIRVYRRAVVNYLRTGEWWLGDERDEVNTGHLVNSVISMIKDGVSKNCKKSYIKNRVFVKDGSERINLGWHETQHERDAAFLNYKLFGIVPPHGNSRDRRKLRLQEFDRQFDRKIAELMQRNLDHKELDLPHDTVSREEILWLFDPVC